MTQLAIASEITIGSMSVKSDVGDRNLIDAIEKKWSRLCSEGPCNEPFFRPECIKAYLAAFEPEAELLLITVWIDDELRGVLPLVRECRTLCGISVQALRSPVNVHSCRFDLVHGNDDAHEVAERIWNFISEEHEWDILELNNVPFNGGLRHLLTFASQQGVQSIEKELSPMPTINMEPGTPQKEVQHYKTFRKRLPNKLKKLESRGKITLQLSKKAAPEVLERFYALEQAGWKGKEGSAIACNSSTRQFYDLLARSAAVNKYLSIYTLELDGKPLAMHYGFTLGKSYYAPKVTYDESFKAYSPGQLLVSMVLDECKKQNLHCYELLGEISEWKKVWANDMVRHKSYTIFSNSLIGKGLQMKSRLLNLARQVKHSKLVGQLVIRVKAAPAS